MKHCILFLFFFVSISAIAQDVIVRHNSTDLKVKILAINENSIAYTYPGESATNTIGKAAVSKVFYASGCEEIISDKVNIDGPEGWENVNVTNNPNDIIGLNRKGEVKAKAGGYWGMRTTKGADKKATERIKKEAVALGAHVLFIQQHETTGRKLYSNPESIQSGVAYGY